MQGCEEIVFEHLEQLASPNLDSDNQKSVFDSVETLYNTDESVRWGNIYAVAKWPASGQGFLNTNWLAVAYFLRFKEPKEPTQFKLSYAD